MMLVRFVLQLVLQVKTQMQPASLQYQLLCMAPACKENLNGVQLPQNTTTHTFGENVCASVCTVQHKNAGFQWSSTYMIELQERSRLKPQLPAFMLTYCCLEFNLLSAIYSVRKHFSCNAPVVVLVLNINIYKKNTNLLNTGRKGK